MHSIIEIISKFSTHENCIAGICDALPLLQNTAGFTPFVSSNILKRTDPAASLAGVKSIIVIGIENKIEAFPPMPEDAGVLSVLGVVDDYHITVRRLLEKLVAEFRHVFDFNYKILVDSPNLCERTLAVKAGLGFIGRNGLLISPEYGSRFNIGLLLTDIQLASGVETGRAGARPLRCCFHGCNKCIEACPSGALSYDGYDVSRCISYLTQKDSLTCGEAKLIGRQLYGCDICQNACPFNSPQPIAWAKPCDWLAMSDADFTKTYGHTAMLWRGTKLLRRNAEIVKKNIAEF